MRGIVMRDIYNFTDWTSAPKMKNRINPCLTIDLGVLRNEDKESIDGYQLTVIDSSVNRILYKFYIDVGLEGTWSLTTDEAIEVLNLIGFPCKFSKLTITVPERAKEILKNLKGLGYNQVYRSIRPATVNVISVEHGVNKDLPLSMFTPYNYHDFWMLDEVPTSIDSLIED